MRIQQLACDQPLAQRLALWSDVELFQQLGQFAITELSRLAIGQRHQTVQARHPFRIQRQPTLWGER